MAHLLSIKKWCVFRANVVHKSYRMPRQHVGGQIQIECCKTLSFRSRSRQHIQLLGKHLINYNSQCRLQQWLANWKSYTTRDSAAKNLALSLPDTSLMKHLHYYQEILSGSYTLKCMSELPAHNTSISRSPSITADSTPCTKKTHFHSAFTFIATSHKSHITMGTCLLACKQHTEYLVRYIVC